MWSSRLSFHLSPPFSFNWNRFLVFLRSPPSILPESLSPQSSFPTGQSSSATPVSPLPKILDQHAKTSPSEMHPRVSLLRISPLDFSIPYAPLSLRHFSPVHNLLPLWRLLIQLRVTVTVLPRRALLVCHNRLPIIVPNVLLHHLEMVVRVDKLHLLFAVQSLLQFR